MLTINRGRPQDEGALPAALTACESAPVSTHDRKAGWRFAIDRGGTFTDIVAWSPNDELHVHKVLSVDPQRRIDPAVRGMAEVLARHPAAAPVASIRLGTTVATNALLERKGEPTLLLTTRGFRDMLRIGFQNRPEIFARHIELPEVLYSGVVEADERIDAQGRVIRSLDEAALRRELAVARQRGLRSLAIALTHGFRYPAHERQAAAIARELGFEEIVVSHQAAPMLGLVSRGDTAVADAYLSPVLIGYLRRFKESVTARFGHPRLSFMQSNGGLVDEAGFRGINAILSGPAGGVIGLVEAGADECPRKLIGLDMGGTSTDISIYAGELPRRFESEIDGVRIQAPMMDVHTIAAGGGSILHFTGGRLQVGPDSAGADPGPACYRRGGPATLTDCNVVLGRILPETFPRVFGPSGAESLDVAASHEALAVIAASVRQSGGPSFSTEEIAQAFISVAVARMANAIRELSLRHGHDASQFTLLAFGGAAGQFACAVSELLGISEILLHPLSGVLSAYGIGLAARRSLRRRSVELPLATHGLAVAQEALDRLEDDVRGELVRQGVPADCLLFERKAQLRFVNSDTGIEVDWCSSDSMLADFSARHQGLYGFEHSSSKVIIASVAAEAIERVAPQAARTQALRTERPGKAKTVGLELWWDGAWRAGSMIERTDLRSLKSLDGPALIIEEGSTGWLAPGWVGTMDRQDRIVLTPRHSSVLSGRRQDHSHPDPMKLEVFDGLFMHVAKQMGVVLRQTASSVNIKERLDFSCAVFDGAANLIANAPHMPVHLGSMGASVAAVGRVHGVDLRPGDAYLLNSPYDGGTHLPDMTVVNPIFDAEGRHLLFFVASRAHHADVGGITPGSMPPRSRDIADEGALIPPTRIVRAGQFDEALVRGLLGGTRWPARNPQQNLADLKAQLAANARGIRELWRAVNEQGLDAVLAYMGHVQNNAEQCMRRAIRNLRAGHFEYELDNGQRIVLRISVDRSAGEATLDFSGTSEQQDNNFNAPLAVTTAAVIYVFRCLIDEPIALNAGCLRPLRIVVPAGSMLDPTPPRAVVAGNVETSQCIVDAIYGALGLQAASQGTMNNLTFGDENFQYYETIAGGSGAGPDYDGASGIQTHMTNSRLTDPEVLETRFPVLVREFSLRPGSGGAGLHRGGDGLVRRLEFCAPMTMAILSNHRRVAPFGLAGGEPGLTGSNRLLRRDGGSERLPASAEVSVDVGDEIEIATPGGGGFGSPAHRTP